MAGRLAVATWVLIALALLSLSATRVGDADAHGDITVLDCQPDNASAGDGIYYGVTFSVDQPFVAIELQMYGSQNESGTWFIFAELIRATTFVGPSEAMTDTSVDLPGYQNPQSEPAAVHLDFGYVPVTGTETFAFRIIGYSGPRDPLIQVGEGDSCPDLAMHNEMTGDELTDRGKEPFFRVLTTNAPLNVWGDFDCSGDVTALDALTVVSGLGGNESSEPSVCPRVGQSVTVNDRFPSKWGNVDCDGEAPSISDVIAILKHVAGFFPYPFGSDCPRMTYAVLVE